MRLYTATYAIGVPAATRTDAQLFTSALVAHTVAMLPSMMADAGKAAATVELSAAPSNGTSHCMLTSGGAGGSDESGGGGGDGDGGGGDGADGDGGGGGESNRTGGGGRIRRGGGGGGGNGGGGGGGAGGGGGGDGLVR
jgi:hypothetical protein